jgi:excisionase family DNA binding protein
MRSIYSHQTGTDTPDMNTNDDASTAAHQPVGGRSAAHQPVRGHIAVVDPPAVLTTSEVSRLLGVSPNTVTRWAREGRLPCRLTLGGHHRFERHVIEEIRETLDRTASGRVASWPATAGRI